LLFCFFSEFFCLISVFIEGEEKGKKDTDGKKYSEDTIPLWGDSSAEIAYKEHQDISKPDGVGGGGKYLDKSAGGNACQVRPGSEMKDKPGNPGEGEGDFFP